MLVIITDCWLYWMSFPLPLTVLNKSYFAYILTSMCTMTYGLCTMIYVLWLMIYVQLISTEISYMENMYSSLIFSVIFDAMSSSVFSFLCVILIPTAFDGWHECLSCWHLCKCDSTEARNFTALTVAKLRIYWLVSILKLLLFWQTYVCTTTKVGSPSFFNMLHFRENFSPW